MTTRIEIDESLCRICLLNDVNLVATVKSCAELIENVAQIKFLELPGMPENICSSCLKALENANQIKEMCRKSKMQLDDLSMVRCCLCSQNFASIEFLEDHSWKIHKCKINLGAENITEDPDQVSRCPICRHSFTSWHDENFHRTCDLCFTTLTDDKAFEFHMEMHFNDELKTETLKNVDSVPVPPRKRLKPSISIIDEIPCNENDANSMKLSEALAESTSYPKNYLFGCCQCKFRSETAYARNLHFTENHQNPDLPQSESEFSCHLCLKFFPCEEDRLTHLHYDSKSLKCSLCSETFESYQTFNGHFIEIHQLNLKHDCPNCDMAFQLFEELLDHMSLVHGEKPYDCKVCGKNFNQKKSMKEHSKRHEGVKQFQCYFCALMMLNRKDLQNHILKRHKNEKKFNFIHSHTPANPHFIARHVPKDFGTRGVSLITWLQQNANLLQLKLKLFRTIKI
uniref:CSON014019 protein n=1 Tax=Culicoides sonorensis TaxID=179676 RepID=A0A336M9B0_CULSO